MNALELKKSLDAILTLSKNYSRFIPSLEYVRFDRLPMGCVVTWSHPELHIESRLETCETFDAQPFMVNIKQLKTVLNKSESVVFESQGPDIYATIDGNRIRLDSIEPVDSLYNDKSSFRYSYLSGLNEGFKVSYAASCDASRFNLSVVRVENNESGLSFVATDGHRISIVETWQQIESPLNIDARLAQNVLKLKKFDLSKCRVEISKNSFRVGDKTLTVTSRLIDGDYPDWKRMLKTYEQSGESVRVVKKADLANAIKKALPLLDKRQPALRVIMNGLVALTNSTESFSFNVGCTVGRGDADFFVNAKYLLDAIESFETKEITLAIEPRDNKPLFVGLGRCDNTTMIMIMRK